MARDHHDNLHFRQLYNVSKVSRSSFSKDIVLSRYWQSHSDVRDNIVCLSLYLKGSGLEAIM